LSAELAPFAIRVLPAGGSGVRVVVEGELDLSTSPKLQEVLARELAATNEVLLDLAKLQFIDSTGLAAILGAVNHNAANGRFKISSSLPAQARRLFQLVGVLDQIPLVDA
jgi:anti-anti-sigma factor